MNFSETKRIAKQKLSGHWGISILFTLVIAVIAGILSSFVLGTLFFSSFITISIYYFYINIANIDIEDGLIKSLGKGFVKKVILSVSKTIYIALWSLLFVIPGIIKTYSYALAEMINMADPEKGAEKCITESKYAMKGEKFDLSFIGWWILCLLTFGLLCLYVVPYYNCARTEYLRAIANEKGYSI